MFFFFFFFLIFIFIFFFLKENICCRYNGKALLLSTNNICFCEQIRKKVYVVHRLSEALLTCFFYLSTAQQSKITIGIAGPDIDNDAHPGHWNNTVGYHSDTGKCFTSHIDRANTKGEKFSIGNFKLPYLPQVLGLRAWANCVDLGPEVIKRFSCSSQLSMKFSLLINMKMPTIVGIFIFISRENFIFSYVQQERICNC